MPAAVSTVNLGAGLQISFSHVPAIGFRALSARLVGGHNGLMSRTATFTVSCPDCGSEMQIDAATGKILTHRSSGKETTKANFDSLMAGLETSKSRAEDIFRQELSALEDRDRLMEEKFKRALERAEDEDDGQPPVRPWDLD